MNTTSKLAVLGSRNEARGFFGTIGIEADPNEAWSLAMKAIFASTGRSPEAVRSFLDSRYGRDFAQEVAKRLTEAGDLRGAIDQAVEHWMSQQIEAQVAEELGIPEGLPCLIGLVCMHEALLQPAGR